MIDIANGEEFSRLIEKLARDVGSASIHWKLYRDVHAAIGKNKAIWNQAPTFWHLTTNAHIFTAMQALSRVYDQNDKALHLRSWLQTIEANLPLFKVEMFRERLAGNAFVDSLAQYPRIPDIFTLKADLLLCSASNPDVKLLLVHRNNIASHRNARAVAHGEEIGALEVEVLERLLEKAILIVNRYSNLFSANSYSATMIGQDDYRSVLSAIASAIERLTHRWSGLAPFGCSRPSFHSGPSASKWSEPLNGNVRLHKPPLSSCFPLQKTQSSNPRRYVTVCFRQITLSGGSRRPCSLPSATFQNVGRSFKLTLSPWRLPAKPPPVRQALTARSSK